METDQIAEAKLGKWNFARRRTYIIRPKFQIKYALVAAAIVFCVSLLMTMFLYRILHGQARMRALAPESYVAELSLVMCLAGLAFAVLTAGTIGVWHMFISHRICGPLFVMGAYLDTLAQGRFPKTRPLRKKDEFKDFYNYFCDTIHTLEARKQVDLETLEQILTIARSATGDEVACRAALNEVVESIEGLHRRSAIALEKDPGTIEADGFMDLADPVEIPQTLTV